MEGLAKLSVLVGCLSLLAGIVLRVTLIPLTIAGYAIIPRTFLIFSADAFLLAICLLMMKCTQTKKE